MCFRFPLTLLFFIVTTFYSYAQDTHQATPEASASEKESIERTPIIVRDVAVLATPIEFRFSDGGRSWTPEDLQNQNIRKSFNEWFRCFHSQAPDCAACNTNPTLPSNVVVLSSQLGNNCLPAPSDGAVVFYPNLLPHQKEKRDDRICSCYTDGNAGPIESYSFEQGVRSRATRGKVWERERTLRENTTEDRVQNRLMTERFATGFSAASYFNNPADALETASRYSARGAPGDTSSARKNIQSKGTFTIGPHSIPIFRPADDPNQTQAQRSFSGADSAEREELTRDLFNGTHLPANYCIPYRNFLASKQFPIGAAFYRDLDTMRTFNARDWDFMALLDELKEISNSAGSYQLAVQNNERAKSINSRLRFLHNNPAMKNLFLSQGNEQLKMELFRKIKAIPRPPCATEVCTRDDNWARKTQDFRRDMAEFMSRQNVIDAARAGSQFSRELQIMLAEDEARMISGSSDKLIPEGELYNPAQWSTFCDARRNDRARRTTGSTGFLQQIFEEYGNRDFKDYTQDSEYARTNTELCTAVRSGPSGQKTFNQFFQETCGNSQQGRCSEENRTALVSKFLKDFPNGPKSPTVDSLMPFLNGYFNLAPATQRDIDRFNTIAKDPELARRPVSFSSSEYVSFNNSRGDIRELSPRESALVRSEQSRRPASTSEQQQVAQQNTLQIPQNQQPEIPLFVPQAQAQAQATQEKQTIAEVREDLSEGESRSRGIRDEISSLQSLIRKENTSSSPDSAAIAGLNQKLSDWERRLRDQTQENQRLQDQIAEMDKSSTAKRAQNAASEADDSTYVTRRPASVPESSAPATVAPQSGGNGGAFSAPVFNGGSAVARSVSPSGVPSSTSGVRTAEGDEGDLGRFGVEAYSVKNGITVAEASSTIDYNRLRNESANSVLPVRVSPEEFGQFSKNIESAISRYMDRVRNMPGQVVRVDFQNGSETLEVFVVKNGDQISVVQAPNAGAQRAPASTPEAESEREFTLKGLQNELTR